jgi:hypothetical protein
MVRLGLDTAGNSITTGFSFIGIREIAGSTCNFYYNTVYLGGSGVASASNTYCFNSNVVTNTRNYFNNIFWNARSNASGGIGNIALTVGGTTLNPPGLASNYNDLYASGVDGAVGVFNATIIPTLANWRTATGQDMMSISADPFLVAPAANAAGVNLHILCDSPARNAGTPIMGITTDFDNDPRSGTTPTIGADELVLVAPTAVSAVSRKTHGGAGDFDVSLPGIEPRSGGMTGDYRIVVTFASPVTVGSATVSSGIGSVAMASGSGTNTITVDLTGVANAQNLTVKLACTDDGVNLGDVLVTMGVLLGDVNASADVGASDITSVKSEVGNPVTGSNFRNDILANGAINSSDVLQVKIQSGTSLPPVANE